ncbi:hypothetical protein [Polymorphospora sp. NPDC050346]|uniref:hypothetical protein n=1 Tax=Polymorphospora sp. NPDC050346 TaxID=3155780 RepID=UPI0033F3F52F
MTGERARPATTAERVLVPGATLGIGSDGTYRGLRAGPGEPHRTRADLAPAVPPGPGRRVLATLAHLTDLHVVDPGSPARLDFAMRTGAGTASWGGAVDWVFRPQELLGTHAAAAMVDTLARLPVDLCVVTGDNVDNAQANELAAYLALLDGGPVVPLPDGRYAGPQRPDWDDDWYWRPDPGTDRYKRRWGFPTHPGLIERAERGFVSTGLGHPWLACLGNHDLLVGGASAAHAALATLVTGDRKPVRLPDGLDLPDALATLLTDPAPIFGGPTRPVTAAAGRAFVDTAGFVAAHRHPGARPAGHGFTPANERDGTGYYRHDPVPGLRVLVLDTNHPHGHWDGSVDRDQLAWLETELAGLDGPDDPLVVLASHHASQSMTNAYGVCPDRPAERAFADELLRIALRCRNVVLWLNGHHHTNRIVAHFRAGGGGLYEVTTAAVTDWPSQARLIEVAVEADGTCCLTSTMVDHDSPAVAGPDLDPASVPALAALHRELAYNDGVRAGRWGAGGSVADRNVRMRVPPRPPR